MTDGFSAREPLWRVGRAEDLVWADYGDEFVVYHRPSGKTHFLNTATAVLLKNVLVEPKSSSAAAEELASREGAVTDQAFFAAVADSIEHLEHLGLVDRV